MLRKTKYVIAAVFTFLAFVTSAQEINYELKTVVIDAGHGGRDPGAISGGVREKDIVLKVAKRTGELIKAANPNVNVIYTRDKDVFVELTERADIANRNKADIFISIHVNCFKESTVSGVETYILGLHRTEDNLELAKRENSVILLEDDYSTRYEGFDPTQAESYIMFELIQNEFLEQSRLFAEKADLQFSNMAKRHSRGVKQAGFLVLRQTTMPSVLIELGYVSNEKERAYMNSSAGIENLSTSIAEAFNQYKKERESSFSKKDNKTPTAKSEAAVDKKDTITNDKPKTDTSKSANAPIKDEVALRSDSTSNIDKQPSAAKPTPTNSKAKAEDVISEISQLNGTWFAIQILASEPKMSPTDYKLSKFDNIYHNKENGFHKYFVYTSQTYDETVVGLTDARKYFPDAFMVAFVNGVKTNIQEVINKK